MEDISCACVYCGAIRKSNIYKKKENKWICRRHYEQLKKYGKLLDTRKESRTDHNIFEIFDDFCLIHLNDNQGNLKDKAIIDSKYLENCNKYKWYLDNCGYARTHFNGKTIRLHQFIWFLRTGENTKLIDHKDRNKLNCKESNLRIASKSLNSINKELQSNNSSGITGVYFNKTNNYWYARINYNKKQKSFCSKEKEECIVKRLTWEFELFGENAPQIKIIQKFYPQILSKEP